MAHTHHKPDGYLSSLVEGPSSPLLTTAEAKAHLHVEGSDDDALIDAYVAAVNDTLDAEFGELGRALVTQTWQLVLDEFPAVGYFYIPVTPMQQILSVTYYDADNVSQTLAADQYRLTANGDNSLFEFVNGATIPSTYDRADAVTVRYEAGYGDAGSDVPESIRLAARALVAHYYENRAAVDMGDLQEVPFGVRFLLNRHRVVKALF